MERIYMDYAATSFIKDEVFLRMQPYLKERFGNPSSVYQSGREAREAIEEARREIARIIGAKPGEIYFTSGGTESNNWAIIGAATASGKKHIVTSAAEHHSVLETCKVLEKQGYEVDFAPVDEYGGVHAGEIKELLCGDTALVSIMLANNEVGTINPINDIAEELDGSDTVFHVDAVAATGHMPVGVEGIDLMSLSAHKFYGPKGTGVLYIRDGCKVNKLLRGGYQERGRRAGTENVAGIVGMAAALKLAVENMEDENKRLQSLRDHMERELEKMVPGVIFNSRGENRLAGYINICLPQTPAQAALIALDMEGIECSSGSACSAGDVEPSHVLMAMGRGREQAARALRFTLGASTSRGGIDRVAEVLGKLSLQIHKSNI